MPTKRPRITIVASPAFDAAISDLAKLTGQSKSATIMDVLEPATPFFEELAQLIRTQQEVKAEPSRQLQANLQDLMQRMTTGVPMSDRASDLLAALVLEIQASEQGAPTEGRGH